MKYPKLVLKSVCKTPITIKIFSNDIGEDGEPLSPVILETKCNFQSQSRKILTDDKLLIDVNGIALFSEDIFPDMSGIPSGTASIFGTELTILKSEKCRNPDGTVNYVRLYLK